MAKTADEVLKGVLSTTLQLDDEGVASLYDGENLKDDALELIKAKDAERVATLRAPIANLTAEVTKLKTDLKSQSMRGKKEAMEEFEQSVREKHGYDDLTKKGQDLVDAIIAKELKAASATDEGKIKVHPLYRELEGQLAKVPELLTAKEQEVVARFTGEQDTRDVRDAAALHFKAWEPVLPADAVKAATLESDFLDLLRTHKFQVTRKDGKVTDIIPMKADGSGRLEDAHGRVITLKDLVEGNAAARFDRKASEARNSAPNPNGIGANGSGGSSGKYSATMTSAEWAKEHERIEALPKDQRIVERAKLKEAAKAAGLVS